MNSLRKHTLCLGWRMGIWSWKTTILALKQLIDWWETPLPLQGDGCWGRERCWLPRCLSGACGGQGRPHSSTAELLRGWFPSSTPLAGKLLEGEATSYFFNLFYHQCIGHERITTLWCLVTTYSGEENMGMTMFGWPNVPFAPGALGALKCYPENWKDRNSWAGKGLSLSYVLWPLRTLHQLSHESELFWDGLTGKCVSCKRDLYSSQQFQNLGTEVFWKRADAHRKVQSRRIKAQKIKAWRPYLGNAARRGT